MPWRKLPLRSSEWLPLARNPLPYAGLITSLAEEHHYECEVEGELPPLAGTLYRIGPGLYDRGPDRKRMLLDGDGMVQALSFTDGKATYRNRFVRTQKYLEEEAAGHFIYPTFSTHGSGLLLKNLGMTLANQANTTVLGWAGRVFGFDESQRPYEIDRNLATLGEAVLDEQNPNLRYWAHWKLDANSKQLHLLAIEQGPQTTANIISLARDGSIVSRRRFKLPRSVYFHDWFVSEHYFAFWLHPAFVDLRALGKVVVGRETFASALCWRPEAGAVLYVVSRFDDRAWTMSGEACWMWHAINAYDDGNQLVCDFVGSALGGGLGGEDAPLFGIMRGDTVSSIGPSSNFIRRMRVDLDRSRFDVSLVSDSANYELPSVSSTERGKQHSKTYLIQADPGELFARNLCQYDARAGTTRYWSFEKHEYCGEPVFCDELDEPRSRFIVSQVYRAEDKKSYFAVFEEDSFGEGPVARVLLEHHVPLSFHGYWVSMEEPDNIPGPYL